MNLLGLVSERACLTRAENLLRQSVSRKLGAQRRLCIKRGDAAEWHSSWTTLIFAQRILFSPAKKTTTHSRDENKSKSHALNRQKNISVTNQWECCFQKTVYVIRQASVIRTFDKYSIIKIEMWLKRQTVCCRLEEVFLFPSREIRASFQTGLKTSRYL